MMLLLVIFVIVGSWADKLSNLTRCSIDDPKIGECIKKVANTLRPRIKNGIDEIGIPSYDPLVLSYFEATQESEIVNYTNIVSNWTLRGIDNYDITEIQYNPESMTFKGKLQFDPLSMRTQYDVTGRLLYFPVRGKGIIQAAMGPINVTFEITGDMAKLKNLDHYNPKDIEIGLQIDDMSLYLTGLFDEDQELAATTNELLNRNSKMIVEAITPALETICESFIMRYFKWLTKTYSYLELFPHS